MSSNCHYCSIFACMGWLEINEPVQKKTSRYHKIQADSNDDLSVPSYRLAVAQSLYSVPDARAAKYSFRIST